ncbi:hypothetical protein EDD15DRAFT_2346224, partial [Pisolithus albus]
MVHEYSKQPWKGLYLAFEVPATLLVRLPVWAVICALPSVLRRSTWSWRHAIALALLRRVSTTAALVGGFGVVPDYRAITPAKDAEGVWIDGVPHLVTAELKVWSTLSGVESIRIPGYWFGKKGFSMCRVFIFFHGGGYTLECAHPVGGTANIVRALIELNPHTPRALSVEYRLSSAHPSPDRYNYLVNVVGYSPCDIVAAGDSAGANLALALVRYLVEHVPPTNDSHDTPGSSSLTNTLDFLDDLAKAFLGPHGLGMASCNRYISPASLYPSVVARFNGFPRTFITAGGAERLLDQIRTLKDKMVADMGADKVT